MTDRDEMVALENTLSEVTRALFAPGTVESVPQRVVDEAVATIEGCDLAGVLLLRGGRVTTSAGSDSLATRCTSCRSSSAGAPAST